MERGFIQVVRKMDCSLFTFHLEMYFFDVLLSKKCGYVKN
jgi:hypothetical protein